MYGERRGRRAGVPEVLDEENPIPYKKDGRSAEGAFRSASANSPLHPQCPPMLTRGRAGGEGGQEKEPLYVPICFGGELPAHSYVETGRVRDWLKR